MKSKSYTKKGPGRCARRGKPTRRLAPMHGPGSLMMRDGTVSYLLRLPERERMAHLLTWHCRTVGELAQFVSIG